MSSHEFIEFIKAASWPALTFFALVLLYPSISKLLDALANSLRLKNVKVKVFGLEVELSPDEINFAVNELLQEIADSTSDLDPKELELFEKIVAARGAKTVKDLEPDFERDDKKENPAWKRFGRLRDRQLARPAEFGTWQSERHPVATKFGLLVFNIRSRNKVTR